jgi:hypothetical protein
MKTHVCRWYCYPVAIGFGCAVAFAIFGIVMLARWLGGLAR